ncbi:hypothetical protein [Shouchella miscanthi]|uniref:Uncharacterized protein n=1 Tax=Shouchella miscanthi TaxID=2598861 RepID=A0ABU6NRK5_9BACI|nr:hypothetical protein [Shouchella miscanthi]
MNRSSTNYCLNRDKDSIEYHADTLAELDEVDSDESYLNQTKAERKAINLWYDGYYEQAISTLEKANNNKGNSDLQLKGWFQQLAARIAECDWLLEDSNLRIDSILNNHLLSFKEENSD